MDPNATVVGFATEIFMNYPNMFRSGHHRKVLNQFSSNSSAFSHLDDYVRFIATWPQLFERYPLRLVENTRAHPIERKLSL